MSEEIAIKLIHVAESKEVWNGVTTSDDGRIFVCFPRIEGDAGIRIGELVDGKATPYPDQQWNSWMPGKSSDSVFVRTNSLRIGPDGYLWIVDTGTPSMGEDAIDGAAKLVAIDLQTNTVARTIPLGPVMNKHSFIDDLRMFGNFIYLTDAGDPALVVMDKQSGQGYRVLEGSAFTTDKLPLVAEKKVMRTTDGKQLRIHADQLEVSPDGTYLYFQPASGPLYRIETAYLQHPENNSKGIEPYVIKWFDTPTTGGTAMDADGNIYISDVNHSAIIRLDAHGIIETIIQDSKLLWGDALWIDKDGFLWIPVGQLNRLAPFQGGQSKLEPPLVIYKIDIKATPLRT